jgi:hypothetical protein
MDAYIHAYIRTYIQDEFIFAMSELLEIEEEYIEITEKELIITRRRLLAESTRVGMQVRCPRMYVCMYVCT